MKDLILCIPRCSASNCPFPSLPLVARHSEVCLISSKMSFGLFGKCLYESSTSAICTNDFVVVGSSTQLCQAASPLCINLGRRTRFLIAFRRLGARSSHPRLLYGVSRHCIAPAMQCRESAPHHPKDCLVSERIFHHSLQQGLPL